MSALIILAITIAGPRIGIVATTSVLIAAQFALATVIDRYGWFGVERIAVELAPGDRARAPRRRRRADPEAVSRARLARTGAPLGALLRADANRAALEGGGAGARARPRLGRGSLVRRAGRRRGERRRSRSCFGRPRGSAGRRPPVAPGHRVRARSGEPVRPSRGADRRPRGGGLGARRGYDPRRRQRDRRRGGAGRCRRRGDRARAARAPLHRLRGAGSRRREGSRRVARVGPPAREPRRDERRRCSRSGARGAITRACVSRLRPNRYRPTSWHSGSSSPARRAGTREATSPRDA